MKKTVPAETNMDFDKQLQSAIDRGKNRGDAAAEAQRAKKLSQEEYVEQDCFEIKPDFFDNILGTHTFSHSDDLLVFDFVKKEKIGT